MPEEGEGLAIRCAACDAEVTDHRQSMVVDGRHEHAFFNPAGIAFEIRCFRQAPGAAPQGKPTTEFAWFSGCQWQLALCTSCGAHLGWWFSGADSFYGLIKARLK